MFLWRPALTAGLYTSPPAQGPMMTEICGITPLAKVLRLKIQQ